VRVLANLLFTKAFGVRMQLRKQGFQLIDVDVQYPRPRRRNAYVLGTVTCCGTEIRAERRTDGGRGGRQHAPAEESCLESLCKIFIFSSVPAKVSTRFGDFASRRRELRGRRRSRSAVKRKRIARRSMLRHRRRSGDQLGNGDQIQSSCGQHRHVQRLTNVASGLRTIRMLVEQAPACREIQQNGASQHGHRPAHVSSSENSPTQRHDLPSA
jgi:hypothetical protein